jgi:hypothetical protein
MRGDQEADNRERQKRGPERKCELKRGHSHGGHGWIPQIEEMRGGFVGNVHGEDGGEQQPSEIATAIWDHAVKS